MNKVTCDFVGRKGKCSRPSVKGTTRCIKHGGSRLASLSGMPSFYQHRLSSSLRELVESQLQCDPSEQLNLLQELALMRQAAGEAVALYSGALEAGDDKLKSAAASCMAEHLKLVQAMCESATRVEAMKKDKLDAASLTEVINQVVRIAYACFGDTPEAKEFDRMIRDKIRIAGAVEQSNVDPNEQVRQMLEATIGKGAGTGITEDGNVESD